MLQNAIKSNGDRERIKELRTRLSVLQQEIRTARRPIIILFEGWGASGKGSLIAELIKQLDPRFFKVCSTLPPTDTERRYPLMTRYWQNIPEYGKIEILDRSWYGELALARLENDLSEKEYRHRFSSVKTFERQLHDDGYLIIKLFLQIDKKEQKKRFEKLSEEDSKKWRVSELDRRRNKHYDEYYEEFDKMLTETDFDFAKWTVIDASDRHSAELAMFETVTADITDSLGGMPNAAIDSEFKLKKMPLLSEVDLSEKTLSPEEYFKELKKLSKKLSELHGRLYKEKIPVVLAFEGWDAAGKGGAIKRFASALDPRGYEAIPIAAPDKTELNHHYLWRFWNHIPKDGHIAIFDRTWYGRVMVERLEGFTPESRWSKAYNEINEFERELTESGVVLVKFWLQIDKDEQLRRFTERQNTPEKQWKITDEDWRNRDKWDSYETAVNEMIEKTSPAGLSWNIIEANDKLYARIKVIKTVIKHIEKALAHHE